MKYQNEGNKKSGGVPHQVTEYPALRYLKSNDEEVRQWADRHADDLEALDKKYESTRRWIKEHQDGREFQIAEAGQAKDEVMGSRPSLKTAGWRKSFHKTRRICTSW